MSEPQHPPAQPNETSAPTAGQAPSPTPPPPPAPAAYPGQHGVPPHPGQQPAQPYPPQQQHPGPQYPGPHYAAHQNASQTYPGPQYPGPEGPASGGSLGRVAFIVSLVALAIGLLVTLSFPFVTRGLYEPSAIGVVSAVGNGLVFIVSVAALILGLLAVRRQGQQILAGIAIGISASAIAGIVLSWLTSLAFALIYS